MHKYILKAFYKKTNKKKYKLQIRQHNVRHNNIIAIKHIIILEKVRKKKLSEDLADITTLAEVA